MAEGPHLLMCLLEGGLEGGVASSSCLMEEQLWSLLPDELVSRVLMMLPSTAMFRFRAVCKRWCYFLTTPQFLRQVAALAPLPPPCAPPICAIRYQPVRMTDTEPRQPSFCLRGPKKIFLDLSFLPARILKWNWSSLNYIAEDGLLCVTQRQWHWVSICVINPFTRTWTELPQFCPPGSRELRYCKWFTKLEVDNSSRSRFKLTLVGTRRLPGIDADLSTVAAVGVYSSDSHMWEYGGFQKDFDIYSEYLLCNGMIFSYNRDYMVVHRVLDGKLLRHPASGVLNTLPEEVSFDNVKWYLKEHLGNMYLVLQFVQVIEIRKLDQTTMKWEKLSSLSTSVLYDLLYLKWQATTLFLFDVVVVGYWICLRLVDPLNLEDKITDLHLIAFQLLDLSWQSVPISHPLQHWNDRVLFAPRLDFYL